MEDFSKRLTFLKGWQRRLATGLTTGLLLVALFVWAIRESHSKGAGAPVEQTTVAERRDFATTISVVGTVEPDNAIAIFAPFDGTVLSLGFDYGSRVTAGQFLIALDTADIRDRQNAAEADFLKARQAVDTLSTWSQGSDVSRARRAVVAASMDVDNTSRKISETRVLLDKGLVPRSEYDGLVQQQQSQMLTLASARDDLSETIKRGGGVNVEIASLDLARSRTRLDDLDAEARAATIRAPRSGIIVRPPRDTEQDSTDLHIGMHVNKAQLLGLIADAGSLSVKFDLDESDINQIKVGQHVTVTGPGFSPAILRGQIMTVGGEAIAPATSSTTKARFAAVARLDAVSPAQAAAIRLGMTANVTIETYAAHNVIVITPSAVDGASPSTTVTVETKNGREERPVVVGHVAPDGVEILSGLKAGDRVVSSVAPTSPPQS